MTNVRRIWHFKLQSFLHREMLNPSITKKFAIAILKVELHYSSIVKKKKKIYSHLMQTYSLLSLIFSVLFSLFLLSFSYALSSLHCGGCGFFFFLAVTGS